MKLQRQTCRIGLACLLVVALSGSWMAVNGQRGVKREEIRPLNPRASSLRPRNLLPKDKIKRVVELAIKSKQSLSARGFGGTIRASMRNPYVADQIMMRLFSCRCVSFEEDYVEVPAFDVYHLFNPVNVTFKPSVAGTYFLDIAVRSCHNERITYTAEVGSQLIEMSVPDANGHVTFLYDAANTDWQELWLRADKWWFFYSCEISLVR